jgi:hypothetical protein
MSENQNYIALENVRLYYNAKRDIVELTAKSDEIDKGIVITIPANTKLDTRIRDTMERKGIIKMQQFVDDKFCTDAYVKYREESFHTRSRDNEFFHNGESGRLSLGVTPELKVMEADLFQGKNQNIAISGDYSSASMLTSNIRQYLKDGKYMSQVYLYKFSQKEQESISSMESNIDNVLELLILLRKLAGSFSDSQTFVMLKNFDSLLNGNEYDSRTDKAARAEVLELIRKLSHDRAEENPIHFVFISNEPVVSDLTIGASSTFVHFGLSHERPSTIDYLFAAFGKECINKTFGLKVTGPKAWGIKGRAYAKTTDIYGKTTESVIQTFTAL